MNKLLKTFVCLIIFLILKVHNEEYEECNKETPIYKNNECVDIFCTENEFQNGVCIINNSIIKSQWLNKIFFFGEKTIKIFTAIEITPEQKLIGSLPWKRIYTTNYDNVLARDNKGWLQLYLPARTACVLKKVKE